MGQERMGRWGLMSYLPVGIRPTHRVVRGVLPIDVVHVDPRTILYAHTRPYVPFRLLQLWTYSPGEDLLIDDIRVGNVSLFVGNGGIPAAAWDIVAVTRAVRQAIAAGWKPVNGEAHPFYERLKIDAPTCDVATRIRFLLRNPTDSVLRFEASLHGVTLDRGDGNFGNVKIPHRLDLTNERFDDLYQDKTPAETSPPVVTPAPSPATPAPAPVPASMPASPIDSECRTCGAMPGVGCYGMSASKTHASRGLKKGDCPGCPRAAWAKGMVATCTFCGRKS